MESWKLSLLERKLSLALVNFSFQLLGKLCYICCRPGPVAQLGARLDRTQEVRGSNPLRSTRERRRKLNNING